MCILSYLHEISNNYINTFLFSTLPHSSSPPKEGRLSQNTTYYSGHLEQMIYAHANAHSVTEIAKKLKKKPIFP